MPHLREISILLALFACVFAQTACGHTDSDPTGSMNVSEGDARTIASGSSVELHPGEAYRLTFSPAAHLEERSGDCSGAITHRATDVTTYETFGEQTACVVVYCASGCPEVEVEVDRLD